MHTPRALTALVAPLPERVRAWTPPGVERWLVLVLAAMMVPWLPLLLLDGYELVDGKVVSSGEPTVGDYDRDAGLALDRARGGNLFELYGGDQPPLMMPLSLLVRLPALGIGQTELDEYRAGVVLCMVAAAATALVFTEWWQRLAWVVLLTCNPLTFEALRYGHPEEVLMGALAVAAVVLSARGKTTGAGVLIGLAIATKQPAVFALAPVLLASARPWRTLGVAVATASMVVVPFLLPHIDAFIGQQQYLAGSARLAVEPPSLWTLFGGQWVVFGNGPHAGESAIKLDAPQWLLSHARLVAAGLVGLSWSLLALRAHRLRRSHETRVRAAWALLIAALALRVALDPDTTAYYALPLVFGVIALALHTARPVAVGLAVAWTFLLMSVASQRAVAELWKQQPEWPFGPWFLNAVVFGGTLTFVALVACAYGWRTLRECAQC